MDPPAPEDCATMADVRAGVDATDRALMALLDRRFGYMRAAARIKPSRTAPRSPMPRGAGCRRRRSASCGNGWSRRR
ncbi:MAG: hypothetical protein ACEQR8_11235 [Cypionkella sp.]